MRSVQKEISVRSGALPGWRQIISVMAENDTCQVYLTGGLLRKNGHSLSGTNAGSFASGFRVDKTVLSIGGISVDQGVTEYHVEESALLRKFIDISSKKIVLCDYSKFGEVALNHICPVNVLDAVFTDWRAPMKEVLGLRAKGVKVYMAEQR